MIWLGERGRALAVFLPLPTKVVGSLKDSRATKSFRIHSQGFILNAGMSTFQAADGLTGDFFSPYAEALKWRPNARQQPEEMLSADEVNARTGIQRRKGYAFPPLSGKMPDDQRGSCVREFANSSWWLSVPVTRQNAPHCHLAPTSVDRFRSNDRQRKIRRCLSVNYRRTGKSADGTRPIRRCFAVRRISFQLCLELIGTGPTSIPSHGGRSRHT